MEIWGITPLDAVVSRKISPYLPSAVTPSWMRAPPESSIPTIGIPPRWANAIIFTIFAPAASPREPPNVEKSCAYTAMGRPCTVPVPVTTESP